MTKFFKVMASLAILGALMITGNTYAGDPDINDDGEVNMLDISLVSSCLFQNPLSPTNEVCRKADPDNDNDIDLDDFNFVIGHFGETGFSFTKNITVENFIFNNGAPYPNNIISVWLSRDEPRSTAEEIATLVNGRIVGYLRSLNIYQIELSTSTDVELQEAIDLTISDPRVKSSIRDRAAIPFRINDNSLLDSNLTEPFFFTRIDSALDLMDDINLMFNTVDIGVLDTDIIVNHPELKSLSITGTITNNTSSQTSQSCNSIYTTPPPAMHGTAVIGIIGADNANAYNASAENAQMNGVLSGIADPSSIYGSKIPYRFTVSTTTFTSTNYLAALEKITDNSFVSIMNLSNGYMHIDGLPLLPNPSIFTYTADALKKCAGTPNDEFNDLRNRLIAFISENTQTTFVIAAGNTQVAGIDMLTQYIIPGNIELSNIITVGGTDVNDLRSPGSAIGQEIDIAAPYSGYYVPGIYNSPLDTSDYETNWSGTSAAAPLITGVVGLMKAIDSPLVPPLTLTPPVIKQVIQVTGDDTGPDVNGVSLGNNVKRVNASRAVACTMQLKGHVVPVDSIVDNNLRTYIENDLAREICGAQTLVADAKLIPAAGENRYSFNRLGSSISIDGNTVLLGSGDGVYIFVKDIITGNWTQQTKLRVGLSDAFGGGSAHQSVALLGDIAIIGASEYNNRTGTAYVFERNNLGQWNQIQKLIASDIVTDDLFGYSVSLSGSTVVIGAPALYSSFKPGTAYVFERNNAGSWIQTDKLNAVYDANNRQGGDQFGATLSISGNTVIIGAPKGYDKNEIKTGTAYVFERNNAGSWGQIDKITAANDTNITKFGSAVSLSGDTAIIGGAKGYGDPSEITSGFGSAYLFKGGNSNKWTQIKKITSPYYTTGNSFGRSVSISGDKVIIGDKVIERRANGFIYNVNSSAYVFKRGISNNRWSLIRSINSPTFDVEDDEDFARSVLISNNTAIIGAPFDDTLDRNSGAAYIYDVSNI